MTWTWLFVWSTAWFIWALLWLSLEIRLGGDPCGGSPGRNEPERREVQPSTRNPVGAPRIHRRCRRRRDAGDAG
jgi:hypothetical protein